MKLDLKTILLYSLSTVLLVVLISFSMRKQSGRYVRDLQVEILEEGGNFFVDHTEAVDLLNAAHTDYVLSLTLDQIDLKMLEARMEEHAFVKDAQIYLDVTGTMQVRVKQARPVARILLTNGKGKYVADNGKLLPLNARHTARVPILEFDEGIRWDQNLYEDELGTDLMKLLDFIQTDPFWKAQVAHMIVDAREEVTMIPQVTKQEIRFGYPDDIEKKFKKLRIFYREILPYKGWNSYAFVDVKFKDQIVCE